MATVLRSGEVVLVGGGPGDPELITVAGLRALQQADVILHDRLGPVSCLNELDQNPELINVGKVPRGPYTPQERINELLIEHARRGRKVVRLKGGDCFVFGRGGEEWVACAEAGIPVRVIPGLTSSVAVPALAGVPLTHRSLVQGFTVVSGHVPPEDPRSTVNWSALAQANTTLVLLMAVKYLPQITARLLESGLAPRTPAMIVSEGSMPNQSAVFSTLGEVAEKASKEGVTPPAIVVIGEVASLELGA